MNLLALPALTDNYIWMMHDGEHAIVVDPGEAAPVLGALQHHRLQLSAILVTHRHGDHTAAIASLTQSHPVPVYGPASLASAGVTHAVSDGDRFTLGLVNVAVWATPGHTTEHVSFVCDSPAFEGGLTPILFCGDTLFSAGCGRIFDHDPPRYVSSLNRLASLPDQTKICCAHEYTLSNIAFAMAVEPGNSALTAYRQHCQNLRDRLLPTLPSTLKVERQVNPYLRLTEPEVIASARVHGAADDHPVSVFTALREWKNSF